MRMALAFSLPLLCATCYKPRMSARLTIGFLGAGKMATALAKGFVSAGLVSPKQVIASDPLESARASFAKEVGAKTTASNLEVARFEAVVFAPTSLANEAQIGRAHV